MVGPVIFGIPGTTDEFRLRQVSWLIQTFICCLVQEVMLLPVVNGSKHYVFSSSMV